MSRKIESQLKNIVLIKTVFGPVSGKFSGVSRRDGLVLNGLEVPNFLTNYFIWTMLGTGD